MSLWIFIETAFELLVTLLFEQQYDSYYMKYRVVGHEARTLRRSASNTPHSGAWCVDFIAIKFIPSDCKFYKEFNYIKLGVIELSQKAQECTVSEAERREVLT